MVSVTRPILFFLCILLGGLPAWSQHFDGDAYLIPEQSRVEVVGVNVDITLTLNQDAPFRVFTRPDPWRLVVDFRGVDLSGAETTLHPTEPVVEIAAGMAIDPGWSRLVFLLDAPYLPHHAAMARDPTTHEAVVTLSLSPSSAEEFITHSPAPPRAAPPARAVSPQPQGAHDDTNRLTIMLDPGHGGVDPGAVYGADTEADLVLNFAHEFRDALHQTGVVDVVLTREMDVFVPLPTRLTLARAIGADAFLSIHADALAEGEAQGATVYTLAETATDAAAARLAMQHDRADLLHGVDLSGADDGMAAILMDLARQDSAPRGRALATTIIATLADTDVTLHRRPHGQADFSVLRAADIPSVLLEIGFMSNVHDLQNMRNPHWRATMQRALVTAILRWWEEDRLRSTLLRQ